MRRYLILIVPIVTVLSILPAVQTQRQAAALPPVPLTGCDPSTQLCISVDATQTDGAAKLRAQGFLITTLPTGVDPSMISALKPQHWRGSFLPEYWDESKGLFGGAISWMVRGEWWHYQRGSGKPPSADFTEYETFVRSLARKHIDQGKPIDYWDIFNEPDFGRGRKPECDGYDPCHNLTFLEEIRHAAIALRSVDPNAKIVVPSTTVFREHPGAKVPGLGLIGTQMDLTTTLDYMVLHNVKIDAISWHELNSVYYNEGRLISPRTAIDHVAKARALVAARPSLGPLEVHINEYSTPWTEGLPGWEAGWVGALEDADVDRSNRSCWSVLDEDGTINNGCEQRTFDQLFNHSGSPRAVYWVHRFYADMTGSRVASSVAAPPIPVGGDDDVERLPSFVQDPTEGAYWTSAFSTRDDTTSTVRTLVGRHYSCSTDGVNPCVPAGGKSTNAAANDEGNRPVPPALDGVVSVKWPYDKADVTVTVQRIPRVVVGAVLGPEHVSTTTLKVKTGETIEVDLGQVADGEAYTVTVSPFTRTRPLKG